MEAKSSAIMNLEWEEESVYESNDEYTASLLKYTELREKFDECDTACTNARAMVRRSMSARIFRSIVLFGAKDPDSSLQLPANSSAGLRVADFLGVPHKTSKFGEALREAVNDALDKVTFLLKTKEYESYKYGLWWAVEEWKRTMVKRGMVQEVTIDCIGFLDHFGDPPIREHATTVLALIAEEVPAELFCSTLLPVFVRLLDSASSIPEEKQEDVAEAIGTFARAHSTEIRSKMIAGGALQCILQKLEEAIATAAGDSLMYAGGQAEDSEGEGDDNDESHEQQIKVIWDNVAASVLEDFAANSRRRLPGGRKHYDTGVWSRYEAPRDAEICSSDPSSFLYPALLPPLAMILTCTKYWYAQHAAAHAIFSMLDCRGGDKVEWVVFDRESLKEHLLKVVAEELECSQRDGHRDSMWHAVKIFIERNPDQMAPLLTEHLRRLVSEESKQNDLSPMWGEENKQNDLSPMWGVIRFFVETKPEHCEFLNEHLHGLLRMTKKTCSPSRSRAEENMLEKMLFVFIATTVATTAHAEMATAAKVLVPRWYDIFYFSTDVDLLVDGLKALGKMLPFVEEGFDRESISKPCGIREMVEDICKCNGITYRGGADRRHNVRFRCLSGWRQLSESMIGPIEKERIGTAAMHILEANFSEVTTCTSWPFLTHYPCDFTNYRRNLASNRFKDMMVASKQARGAREMATRAAAFWEALPKDLLDTLIETMPGSGQFHPSPSTISPKGGGGGE